MLPVGHINIYILIMFAALVMLPVCHINIYYIQSHEIQENIDEI